MAVSCGSSGDREWRDKYGERDEWPAESQGHEHTNRPGGSWTRIGEVLHEESVPVHSRIWVSAADGATAILCSIAEGAALTYYFTRIMGLAPHLASIVWLIFGSGTPSMTHCSGTSATGPGANSAPYPLHPVRGATVCRCFCSLLDRPARVQGQPDGTLHPDAGRYVPVRRALYCHCNRRLHHAI